MRDTLPNRPFVNESAIVNLDSVENEGSHWVCYKKRGKNIKYFDSFGNLKPLRELIDYFGEGVNITYNRQKYQSFRRANCGQLCIEFLLI